MIVSGKFAAAFMAAPVGVRAAFQPISNEVMQAPAQRLIQKATIDTAAGERQARFVAPKVVVPAKTTSTKPSAKSLVAPKAADMVVEAPVGGKTTQIIAPPEPDPVVDPVTGLLTTDVAGAPAWMLPTAIGLIALGYVIFKNRKK